jgi:hypothetical protein
VSEKCFRLLLRRWTRHFRNTNCPLVPDRIAAGASSVGAVKEPTHEEERFHAHVTWAGDPLADSVVRVGRQRLRWRRQ